MQIDYNDFNYFVRVVKSDKKKLAVTSFYCLGQETWLEDSGNFVYINLSIFYNFFP